MKVKLLKKIRKRFSIVHHPDGIISYGDHYKYNIFVLYDNTNSYFMESAQLGRRSDGRKWCDTIFETEKECIDYLKNLIIVKLISDGYRTRKMRRINDNYKKVWYL